jgi:asparagine synthase (glutamine-hydrolysing)
MCGIAGNYRSRHDIGVMLDRIAHRGPDGRGQVTVGHTKFGHVRLAIQDVTDNAAQPMTVGGTTLIYNGEIWNAEELRGQFPERVWKSSSDTEVIAALLDRDGVDALGVLDGMFALAWVNDFGTWIARDRYGKIPIYYHYHRGETIFASEIKAFNRGTRVAAVTPGTAIRCDDMSIHEWVRPVTPLPCEPDVIRGLLTDGIRQRLISDRPVCFLLSGGLDSSLVLALAREMKDDVVAYTAVFDKHSPDARAARKVASELDVPLVEVPVPEPDSEAITRAVTAVEVPMKAQVEIALAHIPLMNAIASDGYRVALSGEAADELFCGYGNMAMAASRAETDDDYRGVIRAAVTKMARGNFTRVNKVMMSAGVEGRLPFMEERLVATALAAGRADNPPGKKALKAAAKPILPLWVINRSKETFQGGTGISRAVNLSNPVRYYNSEAKNAFGWLPKE